MMNSNSLFKTLLAVLLSASMLATGCSTDWVKVALADLPILTQMALNIGTVVTSLQSGQQLSPAEAAAIQNISAQASKDLNLLQALYNDYQQNPNAGTMQEIQTAITDLNQNLPALLQATHISNPAISSRIAAAVNLILATVNSFALLMPKTSMQVSAQISRPKTALPHATDLKKQWNQQICGPSGNAAVDAGLKACAVKP
jgi:hypothetical protein